MLNESIDRTGLEQIAQYSLGLANGGIAVARHSRFAVGVASHRSCALEVKKGREVAGVLRDSVVLRCAQWCLGADLQRIFRERGC
jgi:hypothetical protein